MALRDFWISVRTASRVHAPQPIVDSPSLDEGTIERKLRATTLWIWVFLTEEVSKKDEDFLMAAQRLRAILDPIARRVDPDRWPYLSFRPITEPAEAVEAS